MSLSYREFAEMATKEIAAGFKDQGGLTPGSRVFYLLHRHRSELAQWAVRADVDCRASEGKNDRINDFLKWVEEHWDQPIPTDEEEGAATPQAASGSRSQPAG